jgi:hypothetical protein
MFRSLIVAITLAASFCTGLAETPIKPIVTAPTTKELESFIFVGNSLFYFNNGLPSYGSSAQVSDFLRIAMQR